MSFLGFGISMFLFYLTRLSVDWKLQQPRAGTNRIYSGDANSYSIKIHFIYCILIIVATILLWKRNRQLAKGFALSATVATFLLLSGIVPFIYN
jgi:hypothetical protein